MRYLSIYTPAVNAGGPPDVEHMAKMGALMEKMTKSGALVATGGLGRSEAGIKLSLKNGKYAEADGPFDDVFAKASGWAILEAATRAELVANVKEFLSVAGDGETEIMPIMAGPPD